MSESLARGLGNEVLYLKAADTCQDDEITFKRTLEYFPTW